MADEGVLTVYHACDATTHRTVCKPAGAFQVTENRAELGDDWQVMYAFKPMPEDLDTDPAGQVTIRTEVAAQRPSEITAR